MDPLLASTVERTRRVPRGQGIAAHRAEQVTAGADGGAGGSCRVI
jgi:hypothetical protein